jgi:hypothetical protein
VRDARGFQFVERRRLCEGGSRVGDVGLDGVGLQRGDFDRVEGFGGHASSDLSSVRTARPCR